MTSATARAQSRHNIGAFSHRSSTDPDDLPVIERFWRTSAEAIRPPEILTPSEYADRHSRLFVAGSDVGKWKTYPYQVGILDALTDPTVDYITVKKSTRVGYTQLLSRMIEYAIDQIAAIELDCPILLMQPTIDDAEDYSKDEIGPMMSESPRLKNLVSENKSRDSNNTLLKKKFKGGNLTLAGANTTRAIRRVTARIIMFDEINAYGKNPEGDQIKLGTKRGDSYDDRKVIHGSTPTFKNNSRIDDLYDASDQRRYWVPCPNRGCGGKQILEFKHLKWPENDPERAYFRCTHCHLPIDHVYKQHIVERGEWRAAEAFKGHAGFHIWAAYSYAPKAAWGYIAREFLEAQQDDEMLQVFENTVKAESWEEKADSADSVALQQRFEDYNAEVPAGGVAIMLSVDVQDDRLELLYAAFGMGQEGWLIDYRKLWGDTLQPEVWLELEQARQETFTHESGAELPVSCTVVDSGHQTNMVYAYCNAHKGEKVFALKGIERIEGAIIDTKAQKRPGRDRRKVVLYSVNVYALKNTLLARLQNTAPGPGCIHLPRADWCDAEFIAGLTAEHRRIKMRRGFSYYEWFKVRPRNDPWDLLVYALGALYLWENDRNRDREIGRRIAALDQYAEDKGTLPSPRPPRPSGGGQRRRSFGGI